MLSEPSEPQWAGRHAKAKRKRNRPATFEGAPCLSDTSLESRRVGPPALDRAVRTSRVMHAYVCSYIHVHPTLQLSTSLRPMTPQDGLPRDGAAASTVARQWVVDEVGAQDLFFFFLKEWWWICWNGDLVFQCPERALATAGDCAHMYGRTDSDQQHQLLIESNAPGTRSKGPGTMPGVGR